MNDKAGKGKGPEKVNLDALFEPVLIAFKFYGWRGDNDNDIMSDMDTEGEENPNPKKRKSGPVLEPPSSEEDEPVEDPALIENLIQCNAEALARSQELELIIKGQS